MSGKAESDDQALVARLRNHDQAAFIALYDRYHETLYRWVIQVVKIPEAAEDIVQETFIKIWEIKHRLVPELSFSAYLFRISRHAAFRMLKKIARHDEMRRQVCYFAGCYSEDIENHLQWQQYQQMLEDAVNRLPNQRQRVFKLSRYQNKTYDEIACELDISRNTVKEHMVRALQDIRYYFSSFGDIVFLLFIFFF